ncbi:MAG: DNA alkylation repair protein [Prevotella sp.]|jgi:hypothetical protein
MTDINEKLKEIKRSFRLRMNGPASQSMREKGLDYKVNWGVPLMELKNMAKELGKDYDLAVALWKEDIRECKILATLVMPVEQMPEEVADIWMDQTRSQEMAELQAFNLYQYADFGPKVAYRWIAGNDILRQICGYDILARLFMRGQQPNERGMNEFLDQAITALKDENAGVRHAAMNALQRFAELGVVYQRMTAGALRSAGMENFL